MLVDNIPIIKKGQGEYPKVERSISVKHINYGHLPRPSEAAGFNLCNERLSKHLVLLSGTVSKTCLLSVYPNASITKIRHIPPTQTYPNTIFTF